MSDLRAFAKTKLNPATIKTYEVLRNKRGGYKIVLNWDYENNSNLVGFRIYRAKAPQNLARKDFLITQRALEKLAAPIAEQKTNLLYSKNFFAQNDKVKFFQSNSNRFDQTKTKGLNYSQIAFIRKTPSGEYNFQDHRVKFGETYFYVLAPVDFKATEASRSAPQIINVEDLIGPQNIKSLILSEKNDGILLQFSGENSDDILNYHIYKKKSEETEYKLLTKIQSTKSTEIFFDGEVIPGNEYEYKVYIEDFFGNLSLFCPEKRIEYLSNYLTKGAIPDPDVQILFENGETKIIGFRNHPDIIGYRIERKDVWKFDVNFEIKTFNEIPWPNVIPFESDRFELIDKTAQKGRSYQYRISSISKVGVVESIYVFPPFYIEDGLNYRHNGSGLKNDFGETKILDFNIEIKDVKSRPVIVKFSWTVEGYWKNAVIDISGNGLIHVDNIHTSFFYDELKSNSEYKIKFYIINGKNEKIEYSEVFKLKI